MKRICSRRLFVMLIAAVPGLIPAGSLMKSPCLRDAIEGHLEAGEYQDAIRKLADCSEEKDYHRSMGIAYHGLFLADSALFHLQKAFRRQSSDEVRVRLAESHLWKGNSKQARRLLDEVGNTSSWQYLNARATQYETDKKFKDAMSLIDSLLVLRPNDALTHLRKAQVQSWMKQFELALPAFDSLAGDSVLPSDLRIRAALLAAQTVAWKGELQAAIARTEALLPSDGAGQDARLLLGTLLEWSGRFPEATEQYKEILVADPSHSEAKRRLEKLLWVE